MTGPPAICVTAPCVVYQSEVLDSNLRDQTLGWWTTNGREFGAAGTQEVSDSARDPMIVIEEMTTVSDSLVFPPPRGAVRAPSSRSPSVPPARMRRPKRCWRPPTRARSRRTNSVNSGAKTRVRLGEIT